MLWQKKTRPNVDHPFRFNTVLIFLRKFVLNLWNILSDSRVMQLMKKRWQQGRDRQTTRPLLFKHPKFLVKQQDAWCSFLVHLVFQTTRFSKSSVEFLITGFLPITVTSSECEGCVVTEETHDGLILDHHPPCTDPADIFHDRLDQGHVDVTQRPGTSTAKPLDFSLMSL